MICVQLADAVPVDSRAILVIIVSHMNDKLVTPTSLNERARKLLVKDLSAGLLKSISEQGHIPVDLEEVLPSDAWWHGVGILVYEKCKKESRTHCMVTHS